MLGGIHAMLATLTQTPELEIEDSEAQDLSQSAINVLKHYDVSALDEKTVDMFHLITVCGTVYGTRFMALRMRRANERAERRQQPPTAATRPAPAQRAPGEPVPVVVGGQELPIPPGFERKDN